MSEFEPKEIKKASEYLGDKINLFKKVEAEPHKENIYVIENKKDSIFKRFINSLFK